MIKNVELLKRHPRYTVAEFRTQYEKYAAGVTAQIGDSCLRYVRRYFEPAASGADVSDYPFDVITEMWFEDEAALALANERYASVDAVTAAIWEDGLVNLDSFREVRVVEHESYPQ